MKQPTRGLAHDDHFHVRIACPRGQRDVCVPEPEHSRKAPQKVAKKAKPAKRRHKRHQKPGAREAQAKEQTPRKRRGL